MGNAGEPAPVYRFGVFEVDGRTGELRKQGLKLRVRGRPIDILLLLLARPGEVVTRDELREQLWQADTFVDFDHGLHSAVNRLRDALGESAENPRFIETLPRRGYRFIAPVTAVTTAAKPTLVPRPVDDAASLAVPVPVPAAPPTAVSAPVPALEARPRRVLAMAMAAGLAVGLSIVVGALYVSHRGVAPVENSGRMALAVLPFENLSSDPDQEFFSDGFTEEVISELGMIGPEKLTVIGRTTSMLYKGAKKSIGEIGQELNVKYLLEGSIRRSGSRMRIIAQLVETRSMANIWSDSYERDVGDVLAVQKEVARQIARSLEPTLAPPAANGAGTPRSFAAYELFTRGRFFREQATEDGARRAIEYYERALAADPNYAAAYAAMADAYRLLGAPGWEVDAPSILLPKATAAAERALELDPKSPEARAVLAMIRFNYDWDLPGAEREIKEAVRLNPSFAQAYQYYSSILTGWGRPDDAIDAARRAMELDPLSATAGTSLGVRYYYAGRPEEAIHEFTKTLEVTPGFSVAHWGLAQCYRLQRRFPDQIDQLRSAVQLSGNSTYMRAHLAYGYAVAGDKARAETLRREIEAEGADRYLAPYHLALIAAGLGDTAEAMKWLERAYDDRSGWLVFLGVEPEFAFLQPLPEFQKLLARVKSPN
jgi:TolB-like protein/DNA-binding winged helix-turn-helix (wHTH) protein/tetratricopeptide (TPR) repeat protein